MIFRVKINVETILKPVVAVWTKNGLPITHGKLTGECFEKRESARVILNNKIDYSTYLKNRMSMDYKDS